MCCGPRDTKKPVLFKSNITEHPDHLRTQSLHQASLILTKASTRLPVRPTMQRLAASYCPVQRRRAWDPTALPVVVMAMLWMFLFQFGSSKRFPQIMKETPRSGTSWYMTSAVQRRSAIYSLSSPPPSELSPCIVCLS